MDSREKLENWLEETFGIDPEDYPGDIDELLALIQPERDYAKKVERRLAVVYANAFPEFAWIDSLTALDTIARSLLKEREEEEGYE